MLAPDDLHQIAQLLDERLAPIREDVQRVEAKVGRLEAKLDAGFAEMTHSFEDNGAILGEIMTKLDEVTALQQRVARLERHLGLSTVE